MADSKSNPLQASAPKKPYKDPNLHVYGKIEEIALTTASSATGDNIGKANHKTGAG